MRISATSRSRVVLSQSYLCSNPNASQHEASKACVLVPIVVGVPSSSGLSRFVQPIVYKFPPSVREAFAREAITAPSSPRAGTAFACASLSCPVSK